MTPFDTTNWRTEKILSIAEATDTARQLKKKGKRLVTVNGAFDLLHAGHLDQLEEAKQQGDVLFIGINTDQAIRDKKGDSRPLLPEQARAAMLAALTAVDFVVIMEGDYDSEPMATLLPAIQPHVHVNGPDYGAPETWIEWPVMQQFGTAGYTVQKRNDLSTSQLLEKIKSDGS